MNMNNVSWSVGLSNGMSAVEGAGDFRLIPGEISPWQRLQSYLRKNNLHITSLRLVTASGSHFSLPSAGKNPKFHAFSEALQPVSYDFYRAHGSDMTREGQQIGASDLFAVITAKYDSGSIVQLWIDDSTLNCWVLNK